MSFEKISNWKQARSAYRHFRAEGKLAEARDALQMAIKKIDPPDERELAGLYNQLAKLNLQMRDPISAEAAARKAIDMETQFGPPSVESDHIAAHHVMLADALRQQGKYAEALLALDRGISFYLQHVNADDELILNLKELRNSIETEKWRESN